MNDFVWKSFRLPFARHTESSRKARPVSQNQIRQRKHDIEFGSLFSQTSVSDLLEFQKTLHHPENMFDFATN